jgi:hypothetical protein
VRKNPNFEKNNKKIEDQLDFLLAQTGNRMYNRSCQQASSIYIQGSQLAAQQVAMSR